MRLFIGVITLYITPKPQVTGASYPDVLPDVRFTAGINMTCVEPDGQVKPNWGVLGRERVGWAGWPGQICPIGSMKLVYLATRTFTRKIHKM